MLALLKNGVQGEVMSGADLLMFRDYCHSFMLYCLPVAALIQRVTENSARMH